MTDAPGTGVGCIDGTTARNGEVTTGTYTRGEDDAAIDLLSSTTCGDLTVPENGVELVR